MPSLHARTEILIGEAALDDLRTKTVMIAGLGGVGGFAAEAIARSGVGRMIIIDHDVVSPSNGNRQLLALSSTLGQKKTAIMAARIADIDPNIEVTVVDEFVQPSEAHRLFARFQPDYVLDCIDSIACKAALVKSAQDKGIAVISAMGAGNRLDVRRVQIKPLNQTTVCPLAREFRRHLKDLGGKLNYPVVYSDEPRRQPLPHQPVGGETPGRPRAVNGTISYLPGLFGLMMAGYVVNDLLTGSGKLS